MSDEIKHDVRLVRHHLRRQVIDQKQHDEYLASLPDDAEHATETETRFVGYSEAEQRDDRD